MSVDAHREALRAYDEALGRLYGGRPEASLAAVSEQADAPVEDEALAEQVVAASSAAGETAGSLLDSEDERVREVGEAQLAALAARDFAVAHDLALLDPEEGAAIASEELDGRPALAAIQPDLALVLDLDPRDGVPVSGGGWNGMATFSSAGEDPRVALERTLRGSVDKVRDATREVVSDGIDRLLGGAVAEALGHAAGNVFRLLPDRARPWLRWAVKLFRRGIEKLKRLLGPLDGVLRKIADWLRDQGFNALLDFAYGTKALKEDLSALVQRAADGKDFAVVGTSVDQIVGRYETQKKVLLLLFKGLSFCRKWILRVISPPTGDAVVAGAFGLGVGYAVFSGGDYIDWTRTKDDGFLDFVKGIRGTAEEALA